MESNNIATLVAGVENIGRMRGEIKVLIGLLLSMIKPDLNNFRMHSETALRFGKGCWSVGKFGDLGWDICHTSDTNCVQVVYFDFDKGKPTYNDLPAYLVPEIYLDLQSFVDRMKEIFPEIDAKLNRVISAAEMV